MSKIYRIITHLQNLRDFIIVNKGMYIMSIINENVLKKAEELTNKYGAEAGYSLLVRIIEYELELRQSREDKKQ